MTGDSDRIGAIMAAMAAGAPWWLALEATASTALDRDETCGTYSLPAAEPPLMCDRCGRHLPCRHCPPVGDDGFTDDERDERMAQWQATIAARPNAMEIAALKARVKGLYMHRDKTTSEKDKESQESNVQD